MIDKPFTIGCDEVGYGALAGPLVVVGVRAPKDWALAGLNDSKKLSAKKRGAMLLPLMELVQNKEISYHLAVRSNEEIDKTGVAVALKSAYVEVFRNLYQTDSLIISDGILKFDNLGVDAYDKVSVVKADTKFPTVMAASIIAKEWRDDKMKVLHDTHPQYGWDHNMGYPTALHVEGLKRFGYTPLHRLSYKIKNLCIK